MCLGTASNASSPLFIATHQPHPNSTSRSSPLFCAVNAVLDFSLTPSLGVGGAAWATAISQWGGLLVYVYLLALAPTRPGVSSTRQLVRLEWRGWPTWGRTRTLREVGVTMVTRNVFVTASYSALTSAAAGESGLLFGFHLCPISSILDPLPPHPLPLSLPPSLLLSLQSPSLSPSLLPSLFSPSTSPYPSMQVSAWLPSPPIRSPGPSSGYSPAHSSLLTWRRSPWWPETSTALGWRRCRGHCSGALCRWGWDWLQYWQVTEEGRGGTGCVLAGEGGGEGSDWLCAGR